jgi:hypothetical protein
MGLTREVPYPCPYSYNNVWSSKRSNSGLTLATEVLESSTRNFIVSKTGWKKMEGSVSLGSLGNFLEFNFIK